MLHQARRIRRRALAEPGVVCFSSLVDTRFGDGRPRWVAGLDAGQGPPGTPGANEALTSVLPRYEHMPDPNPNLPRCFVPSAATSPPWPCKRHHHQWIEN